MSVKRYEFELYHCNGGEMLVSDAGDYVSYEDYAALEARCAALAAESAGLKKANEIALKILNDEETLVTSLWASSVQEVEVKTTATDTFLAEVRAQGVDVAIEHLINKFEGTGRIGVPVIALEWLAKELRKGVQS